MIQGSIVRYSLGVTLPGSITEVYNFTVQFYVTKLDDRAVTIQMGDAEVEQTSTTSWIISLDTTNMNCGQLYARITVEAAGLKEIIVQKLEMIRT